MQSGFTNQLEKTFCGWLAAIARFKKLRTDDLLNEITFFGLHQIKICRKAPELPAKSRSFVIFFMTNFSKANELFGYNRAARCSMHKQRGVRNCNGQIRWSGRL